MTKVTYHQIESRSAPAMRLVKTNLPSAAAYVAFIFSFVFTTAFVFGAF
jgi:hypothetical protein